MQIETARLVIRSFHNPDFDEYYSIVSGPDVMKHLGGVLSKAQAQSYIDRAIETEASRGFARYAIELKNEGGFVGMCGFAPVKDYIDLGYRFSKHYWGIGFATEAANAIVSYGFSEHGFGEIVGLVHPENIASISVLEKVGFSYQREEVTPIGMPAKRYQLTNKKGS